MSTRIEQWLQRSLDALLAALLFLLPWGTVWQYRVPVQSGAVWQYGVLGWYASEVLLWGMLLVFMAWSTVRLRRSWSAVRFSWTPDRRLMASLLLFIAWVYASIIWSGDPSLALVQATRVLAGVLLGIVVLVGPYDTFRAMIAFVSGAVIQAGLGMWQFVTQSTVSSVFLGLSAHPVFQSGTAVIETGAERWLRAYAAFPHPNIFGGYMVLAMMVVVAYALTHDLSRHQRLVAAAASFFLFTGFFVSFSRSAWIAGAAMFGAMVCLAYHLGQKFLVRLIVMLAGYGVMLLLVAWPLVLPRVMATGVLEARSLGERTSGYTEAYALIRERPFTGVGVGNYTAALHTASPGQAGWYFQPVHMVPLLVLAELGVIGCVLLGSVFTFGVRYVRRHYPAVWWVVIVFNIPLVVIGLFDHYFWSLYIGVIMAVAGISLAIRSSCPQLFHTLSTIPKNSSF